METVLVTGGTGYIGSHMVLVLLQAGYSVVVLDNLSNSHRESLRRVEKICEKTAAFIEGDIRDEDCLARVFEQFSISAVMHFAGLKAVGESVDQPLEYYDVNVVGTLRLLAAMKHAKVKALVFSSSATVYGEPASVPISEDFPLSATNPYGKTKLHVEEMLRDLYVSDDSFRIALLRYFNPVGAHQSGLIGEDPSGVPSNLMPYIAQVATGLRSKLSVFGGDYDTADGTGVRDYIHVMDLVEGHLAALQALLEKPQILIVNLGTGQGYSVLEMVAAFERASGQQVPYEVAGRRLGDIGECYANPDSAAQQLGWRASRGLALMCEDHWRWQKENSNGYDG